MEAFKARVIAFSDTLPVLREHMPERTNEKKSFSLTSLVSDLIGPEATAGAHNAIVDVHNLRQLIDKLGVSELVKKKSKSTTEILQERMKKAKIDEYKTSLNSMKISTFMKRRISGALLSLEMLANIYRKDGEPGITFLLSESIEGKPRVTRNKRVIAKIVEELHRLVTNTQDNNNNNHVNLSSEEENIEIDSAKNNEEENPLDFGVYEYLDYEVENNQFLYRNSEFNEEECIV